MNAPDRRLREGEPSDPLTKLFAAVPAPTLDPVARTRLLARVRASSPQSTTRSLAFGAALAAAGVLLFLGIFWHRNQPAPVAPTASARATGTLDLANEAHLEFSDGSRWNVERPSGGAVVRLDLGRVVADVAPHAPERPFVVVTPHARVVVVGTRLDVEVDARATRVHVEHGLVRVEHAGGNTMVAAGESWSSSSAPVPSPAPPPTAPVPEKHARARETKGAVEASPSPVPLSPAKTPATLSSALAEEEAVLAGARDALYRDHNGVAAIVALDAYAAKFPDGALVRESLLLRLSAGAEAHRADVGADAARRFLAAFPDDPRHDDVRRALAALCPDGSACTPAR